MFPYYSHSFFFFLIITFSLYWLFNFFIYRNLEISLICRYIFISIYALIWSNSGTLVIKKRKLDRGLLLSNVSQLKIKSGFNPLSCKVFLSPRCLFIEKDIWPICEHPFPIKGMEVNSVTKTDAFSPQILKSEGIHKPLHKFSEPSGKQELLKIWNSTKELSASSGKRKYVTF